MSGLILRRMKCFVLFKILSLIRFHSVLTIPLTDIIVNCCPHFVHCKTFYLAVK